MIIPITRLTMLAPTSPISRCTAPAPSSSSNVPKSTSSSTPEAIRIARIATILRSPALSPRVTARKTGTEPTGSITVKSVKKSRIIWSSHGMPMGADCTAGRGEG